MKLRKYIYQGKYIRLTQTMEVKSNCLVNSYTYKHIAPNIAIKNMLKIKIKKSSQFSIYVKVVRSLQTQTTFYHNSMSFSHRVDQMIIGFIVEKVNKFKRTEYANFIRTDHAVLNSNLSLIIYVTFIYTFYSSHIKYTVLLGDFCIPFLKFKY